MEKNLTRIWRKNEYLLFHRTPGYSGQLTPRSICRGREAYHRALSLENRVLLMRRYWFSDSYGEIAAQTGLSEKNVSVRLTRIRKQLRHYFEERGGM